MIPAPPDIHCRQLFVAFTLLALQGFGGVLAVAQRELCERRKWLSHDEFVELLSVAQVLPGPNICNMAVMIGDRFAGTRGALSALAGMMLLPLILVLALTAVYAHFADLPAVAGALKGMTAVSAGLIIGTGLKLAPSLRNNPLGLSLCLWLVVGTFVLVAILRWPLLWVMPGMGLPACYLVWFLLKKRAT